MKRTFSSTLHRPPMVTSMRRKEHTIARIVAMAGLVATFGYLLWRTLYSLVGTDLWLSIPALIVEVAGFVGSAVLVWGLWPRLDRAPVAPLANRGGAQAVDQAVDVVVLGRGRAHHEVRATLVALRAVTGVNEVTVVDGGLMDVMAAVRTHRFLLLDAGDIPTTDIVTRLTNGFTDDRIAIVQGLGACFADDSIEHGPGGRHDLTFERAALTPALGTRGCAFWTGSGSLILVDALREALPAAAALDGISADECALEAMWAVSSELMSAGWRIVAPVDVAVVAHQVEHIESAVYTDRRARVRAARRLVVDCALGGRSRRDSATQRLATLAWCVRPLSGVRRAAFIAVLVLALYAGSPPFNAALSVTVVAWLPGMLATTIGIGLLSGWRLRPGDRVRWSLVSMGPACSSWRTRVNPIVATSGSQFGAGVVVAVTGLCVVLVLRGISDQFTHTLGRLPRDVLFGLLVVSLWTLAFALDVLRMLSRRPQPRQSARAVACLPAMLGERSAKIVDLTPQGAGLLSQTAVSIGERVLLVSQIPTAAGVVKLHVVSEVRTVTAVHRGCWRIGVHFGELDGDAVDALAGFCVVEPLWERLGVMPGVSVTEARRVDYVADPLFSTEFGDASSNDERFIGRGTLRLLAFVALLGAIGSSLASNVTGLGLVVVGCAAALGISLLWALIPAHERPRSQSSSFSPDLAIR